ncbi:Gfo/Idh/MocA family oxidoreductase [Rhizobium lentis]|uniref:Gfo/Idh/MocA family protein n=1 Tax=Rhizobium lentis TaxID=1138194 RepID=UPI001C830EAF|nr:Gfo/Idh/MocA family oxidoreductase [Rhizobium lentis]MBX5104683.1 Gfo/Idh/MocA family oxidoreductase [Rhizobium lentis]
MNEMVKQEELAGQARPVRLGFLGVGWIGRHRMQAILNSGAAQVVAIADSSENVAREAADLAPGAKIVENLDALLAEDIDGVVVATPSAQHAEQSIRALDAGMAVFCQKPLGRTGHEVRAVIDAAKAADRLLGVDLSYRHTQAMRRIRELVREGELGDVFAADLTFHNAYGPDKPWFYDKALSGGGCMMDLGIHLIDLALWALDFPEVEGVSSHIISSGQAPDPASADVEDYGLATLGLKTGTIVRVACSWRLQAGCDAIIAASFFGTKGGASMRNVGGSFYDFAADRFAGTSSERLLDPPDDWGGRSAIAWVRRLAEDPGFDNDCRNFADAAQVLDRIYAPRK